MEAEPVSQAIKPAKRRKQSHADSEVLGDTANERSTHTDDLWSGILSKSEVDALISGIIEVGGPYWERILALHGAHGSRSEALSARQPHQLWNAVSQIYCNAIDSGARPLPEWLLLAAKSLTLQPCGLREKEVIQAAYDAYGWSRIEDATLVEALQDVGAPEWSQVYAAFVRRLPEAQRTQQEIEYRAVVLHRFHTFNHGSDVPAGLLCLRTAKLNSFGVPWNIAWSEEEDATLLEGIKQLKGPYWAKILALYGASGTSKRTLAAKTEIDLAERAREWRTAAAGSRSENINDDILESLQYLQPKGLTASGYPTSRGWSDEQDKVLISELKELKAPNYNEMLLRHGVHGQVSERLAPKNYAQLRGRALKIYDYCVREGKPLPEGLEYAKRGTKAE